MFYIHQASCISAQQTFDAIDLDNLREPVDKKMLALEPAYAGIPPGVLRRMGKAVRMGVGAAMPLLQNNPEPDGIIIGTANGGKEDCVKFLNQIIEYDEGMLTPINFVQSTPNAVAAQIGLLTNNHGYNISHLHSGLAFEFAAIDTAMLLKENPSNNYLLGAVDDISIYNYNFEEKRGWYKNDHISNTALYSSNSKGCIPGEAATMFLVDNNAAGAMAKMLAVDTIHHTNETVVKEKLQTFIAKHVPEGEKIDLLLSGENGDSRFDKYYTAFEPVADANTVARFKHISGEYPTATAMAVWLATKILNDQTIPQHMIKKTGNAAGYKNILICNTYQLLQHSFMLLSVPY
jgi:hypothetical protein